MQLRKGVALLTGLCIGFSTKSIFPPSIREDSWFIFWCGIVCYIVYWMIFFYELIKFKGGER